MKSKKIEKKPKLVKPERKDREKEDKEKSQPQTNYCRDCDLPEGLDW